MSVIDPLGVQPRPTTGRRSPAPASERAQHALAAASRIWVPHGPQEQILGSLRTYVAANRGKRRVPLNGKRLSQEFQAGKSSIAWRLKLELEQERLTNGLEANPHQVLIVTINRRMTLRQFYQAILVMLEDDFYDAERLGPKEREQDRKRRERRSSETLQEMVADWCGRLEVDLIVIDEVQRLDRESSDAEDVTEEIQTFCDRGIVPLLLIGNEESATFLNRNRELAVRLGTPLRLEPLPFDDAGMSLFMRFCRGYDRQLQATGCTRRLSGLASPEIADALLEASTGHVGRAARIIQEALTHAVARDADFVEAHDLSFAVRNFAIGLGWVVGDPFSLIAG